MRVQIQLFILATIVVLSCQKENNTLSNDWGLVKTDSLMIELDFTQGFFKSGLSQFEKEGKPYLSILNKLTGVVSYYNMQTSERIHTVQLEFEGENGIGTNLTQTNHFNISHDSLVIISDWQKKIYLLNAEGKVQRKYDLMSSDIYQNDGPIIIYMTNDNRPTYQSGNLYFNAHYLEYNKKKNNGNILKLNLSTGTFSSNILPPDHYYEKCWGTAYSLNTFHTRINNNTTVISYGVDPNLYYYTNDTKSVKPIPSRYFKPIEPWSDNINDYKDMSTWQERKNHSVLGPKYYKLVYLDNPKILLRETFLPRTEEEMRRGIQGLKKSIQLISGEFEFLGEHVFETDKYFTSNYLVTPDGIYIANYKKYAENEDLLQFDLYEPKKIK